MIMVHGDDQGLKMPPRVAPIQAMVVPIFYKEKDALKAKAAELEQLLVDAGVRAESDCSDVSVAVAVNILSACHDLFALFFCRMTIINFV
jgi:prolyl-tRNA synthetase